MSISVLCAIHDRGGLAATALEALRPIVDEVVVGFDSRVDRRELGPLEDVADVIRGFEFIGPNTFRPWLREQAAGEWLLLLDGDELPSQALLDHLAVLTADRNVAGYVLPRVWVYPDTRSRLASEPWAGDRLLRLVRNDSRLRFPARKHTGAECDLPTPFVDAPLIHLDLIINGEAFRRRKVAEYDEQCFGLMTLGGLPLNDAFYLPEDAVGLHLAPLESADVRLVARALAGSDRSWEPRRDMRVADRHEVARWLPWAPLEEPDHRGELVVRQAGPHPLLVATAAATLSVQVTNRGNAVWPAAHQSEGPRIALSYHWRAADGQTVVHDGVRSPLPCRLGPGETVEMMLDLVAPPVAGSYVLVADLVNEGVRWFGVDREVKFSVAQSLRDQLTRAAIDGVVPVESAIAIRRSVSVPDGLVAGWKRTDDVVDEASSATGLSVATRCTHRGTKVRLLRLGSGPSTLELADAVAAIGGALLCLDHDADRAAWTTNELDRRGMDGLATVRVVALEMGHYLGLTLPSYALRDDDRLAIIDFGPQVVVIGGAEELPIGLRAGAVPAIAELLVEPATFLLGDALLDAELEMARRWSALPAVSDVGIRLVGRGVLVGTVHPAVARPCRSDLVGGTA